MQRLTILASLAPLSLALAGCSSAAETEASEAQAAAINATDVIAYSDGGSQAFAIGTFRANQGQLGAVGNDAIRSLQVPNGLELRVCEHEGDGSGGGTCATFGAGDHGNLGALDRSISYLEVRASGPGPRPSNGGGEQARAADAFVDAFGVNMHLGYSGYSERFGSVIKPALREIGIRHVRDGHGYFDNGSTANMMRELHRDLGVRVTLIYGWEDPAAAVPRNYETLGDAIEGIEGPNEINLWPFPYKGENGWAAVARRYQEDLWNAVKGSGNPAIRALPVHSVTTAPVGESNQIGNIDGWTDFITMHPYQNGNNGVHEPTSNLYEYMLPNVAALGGKQISSTESGYCTPHGELLYSEQFAASERAAGRYIPRIWLEHFNNNIFRTYIYEFVDQNTGGDCEANFGMVRSDGSLKPHAVAVKNLNALLGDPGPGFAPGHLDYTLSCDVGTSDDRNAFTEEVHHTLLQKRNGEFYLVLWNGAQSADVGSKQDREVADRHCTVRVATPIGQVQTFLPLESTDVRQTFTTSTFEVGVPDHPLVIRLTPP